MIIGGSSGSVEPLEAKRSRLKVEVENAIIFIERDTEGVLIPHNDAVAVTAIITDFNVHRIFIDNESLIDVLYFSIFTQMGFTLDQLTRFNTPIQSFSESSMILEGMIRLPLTIGTPPQ